MSGGFHFPLYLGFWIIGGSHFPHPTSSHAGLAGMGKSDKQIVLFPYKHCNDPISILTYHGVLFSYKYCKIPFQYLHIMASYSHTSTVMTPFQYLHIMASYSHTSTVMPPFQYLHIIGGSHSPSSSSSLHNKNISVRIHNNLRPLHNHNY